MYYVNNDYLAHIGNENSGRYPRGSGKYPRSMRKGGFLWRLRRKKKAKDNVEVLRKPSQKRLMEIINSGDPREVYKYRKFMSTNDLNAAKNRIDAERNMLKYAQAQRDKGLERFERYADKWDRTTSSIEKFANGYNRIAKISNSIGGTKLPTLSGGGGKKAKVHGKNKVKNPQKNGNNNNNNKNNNGGNNGGMSNINFDFPEGKTVIKVKHKKKKDKNNG